jgi:hypothetical protein
VTQQHKVNLMTAENISICFAPCLFKSASPGSFMDIANNPKFVQFIHTALTFSSQFD